MAKSKTKKTTPKNLRAKSDVGSLRSKKTSPKTKGKTKSKSALSGSTKVSKSTASRSSARTKSSVAAGQTLNATTDNSTPVASSTNVFQSSGHNNRNSLAQEMKRRLRFLAKFSVVATLLGAMLVTFAIVRLKPRVEAEVVKPALPVADKVIVESVAEPSEAKPETPTEKNVETYVVPASEPRRIVVSSLGINGYIQKVGLDKTNTVVVPDNIHFAGWYTKSVKPGEVGVSLIAGHVGGRYNEAIFKLLGTFSVGSTYEVEYGDLSLRKFIVEDIKQVPEKDAASIMLQPRAGAAKQLNLITCGGKLDQATGKYADRVIIISRLVE